MSNTGTYTLLLDTSSLMYRAFYALPSTMVDEDGHPINAVHGYLDMTARLQREYEPDELIHVFDADWRPAGRVERYPPYKADRPEEPEDLTPQFTLLRRVLDACGLPLVEAPDWEADDAIGTLCAQGKAHERFDIVTGDRDLLQLVQDESEGGPTIRVLYTVRGVSNLALFDEAAVTEKYGVPPQRYVDFSILRGDPSDGLPGVKGIGEKTAAKLIQTYPTLDALLDDMESQTPRMAQNLQAAKEYIATMFDIVPIRQDVAITKVQLDPNQEAIEQLKENYRLSGPFGRLGI
ncbi:MAG: 5'-3' exonuclease H3TH domain-containing protein [Chloroflexota bacterium]